MNVCGKKIPPASILLINNEIDIDDFPVAPTSDLTNALISEGIKYIVV